jgi:hypothetical protein
MLKFILERALLLPDRTLVIADLHLGLEHELAAGGITVPSQARTALKRLTDLAKLTRASALVILGDIKHNVPGASWQELREIPELLGQLAKKLKVTVIKGNHDAGLERLAPPEVKIHSAAGLRIRSLALVHGHAWPAADLLSCETLIMAHAHPAIEFWSGRFRALEPVWLRCSIDRKKLLEKYGKQSALKEAIIMPAFGKLIGGTAFNTADFKPIGPLLRKAAVKWQSARIYLLDGTYLGSLRNCKSKR